MILSYWNYKQREKNVFYMSPIVDFFFFTNVNLLLYWTADSLSALLFYANLCLIIIQDIVSYTKKKKV